MQFWPIRYACRVGIRQFGNTFILGRAILSYTDYTEYMAIGEERYIHYEFDEPWYEINGCRVSPEQFFSAAAAQIAQLHG